MAQDDDRAENSPPREGESAGGHPADRWDDRDRYPRRICTYNPEHWP